VVINPHPASIRVRFSSPECSAIYSGLGLETFSQDLCLETEIKIETLTLHLDFKIRATLLARDFRSRVRPLENEL